MAKERQVIELYFKHGEKPSKISRLLRMSALDVERLVDTAKRHAKKLSEPQVEVAKKMRMCERPDLLEAVTAYLETNSTFNVTVPRIIEHLHSLKRSEPEKHQFKVPSATVIKQILHEKLFLRKATMQTSTLRYKDPTYNEKRLWISRLLAQFMFEDALIITVDESHFRSDQVVAKQW